MEEIGKAIEGLEAADKDLVRVVEYPSISTADIDLFFERVSRLESVIKVLNNE